MRNVTKNLIRDFHLLKFGCDFMSYKLQKELDFHHFLVSRKKSKEILGNDGYIYTNGVILNRKNHIYLHDIQIKDEYSYWAITSEFLKMHGYGEMREQNLREIGIILDEFEKNNPKYEKQKELRRKF